MVLGGLHRFLGGVDGGDLGAHARERLCEQAAAAADVQKPQTLKRLGPRSEAEMLGQAVANESQARGI